MKIEGWYVDAMEQMLGQLLQQQAKQDFSVEELAEMLLDPETGDGRQLTPDEHLGTLAICVAILARRLARVDVPT